jgi:replication factor C subunit 3/5
MSDYEDEMDIDVPISKDVTFSSDNAGKGKRSAANLPVEAEDSLPWYVCIVAAAWPLCLGREN